MQHQAHDLEADDQAEEPEPGHPRALERAEMASVSRLTTRLISSAWATIAGAIQARLHFVEVGREGEAGGVEQEARHEGHRQVQDERHPQLPEHVVAARERARQVREDRAGTQVVRHEPRRRRRSRAGS